MEDSRVFALDSLEGLSVGDAIGEALAYHCHQARDRADFSAFRKGTIRYTDDTEMALGIVELLLSDHEIHEDRLAEIFATRFRRDPDRGYGRMARRILDDLACFKPWQGVSASAFGGGSFGNGAAMRVAPLGAYFHRDLELLVKMAVSSARVTHYHPEGIAGAIAVAVAAGVGAASRKKSQEESIKAIWEAVIEHTPKGECHRRLVIARSMIGASNYEVAGEVGNGSEVSAMDTVPFCIWNACRCLNNYREGILSSVEIDGDCDTNAAITGGLITAWSGPGIIPVDWRTAREALGLASTSGNPKLAP